MDHSGKDKALSVRIVTASKEDAPAIARLTRAAYADWVPILGREPLPMVADYQALVLIHRFDLLYRGEALAALLETVAKGRDLWIENIAVDPRAQGRGYGGRLLRRAEDIAAAQGFERLTLYTNKLMTKNIQIYQRYGFDIEREERTQVAEVVYMAKTL